MFIYKILLLIVSLIGLNLLSVILSYLRRIHSNIISKRLDDNEYLCRKLNGGDSSVSHYIIEDASKEDMERIHKVKHVSVGYKLDYVDDNHIRYTTSLSSGTTDKDLPPLKLPDGFKLKDVK